MIATVLALVAPLSTPWAPAQLREDPREPQVAEAAARRLLGGFEAQLSGALIGSPSVCGVTAHLQARATLRQLQQEYLLDLAGVINETDPDQVQLAWEGAWAELVEGYQKAVAVHAARLDLCTKLGGGAYDPLIDPTQFGGAIDNPYMPLPRGARWRYERVSDEGLEVVEITVLAEQESILGVPCTVVYDLVTLEGELIEETRDFFAQDSLGNVWMFGEETANYEEGGFDSFQGSWKAGEDGAKPGIVMSGLPEPGDTYRIEYLLNEAEDAATVHALGESEDVPAGRFTDCLRTGDFTPLEPDEVELKTYAPGVGLVHEQNLFTGEVLQLVSYSIPGS